jgi:hypothetical protein
MIPYVHNLSEIREVMCTGWEVNIDLQKKTSSSINNIAARIGRANQITEIEVCSFSGTEQSRCLLHLT